MPLLLVVLFIGIPILELSVIDQVQNLLGWPYTLLLLFADSLLGAVLVRQEGMRAWRRFTRALAEGQPPTSQVIDGALILFGGALLLTPGFVTDIVGLACVLGPTRSALNGVLLKRFSVAAGPLGSLFMVDGRRSPRGRRPSRPDRDRGDRPDQGRPGGSDGGSAPPTPPGVIDVEVLDVQRNDRGRRGGEDADRDPR